MSGVPIGGPSMMNRKNLSVVLNTTVPSRVLKNKWCTCVCHGVRETIVAKTTVFKHINSAKNFANVLTKALDGNAHCALFKPHLFWNTKWETRT